MTDTNRIRLTGVRETTLGTTPSTPRMRALRVTNDGLNYAAQYENSEERRDDRMIADPVKVGEEVGGTLELELHFPPSGSLLRSIWESQFFNSAVNTPERDNDGTADSVITAVTAATGTVTVTTGTAYVIGHLVRHTGFGPAANNGLFRVTTGGATSYIAVSQGLLDETAPAANARSKVVGFQGASADITATATGLGSTSLNFTTLGLQVGQWIKVGGTGAAFRFDTVAVNSWARITAITATALTLDNRPAGWGTDSGTGKTIRVFFGDRLVNGLATIGHSFEKGFMGQGAPTYIVPRGMVADTAQFRFARKQKITGTFTFVGMGGTQSTTSLDTSPDPAPSVAAFPIMAASAHLGRVNEGGAQLTTPNWVSSIELSLGNALRRKEAVDAMGAVDIGAGGFSASVVAETYFGDNALLTKALAGTPTSINWRAAIGTQAMVWDMPRATIMPTPAIGGGRNSDAMLSCTFMASRDDLTAAHFAMDMLEYVE
jgi:hypothetical protein